MSGRSRNWTPPPTQIVVPPKVAVVKSWAEAGWAKAPIPSAVAAIKYADLFIEGPRPIRVCDKIAGGELTKGLSVAAIRRFRRGVAEKPQAKTQFLANEPPP